jgi:hypothetical protein
VYYRDNLTVALFPIAVKANLIVLRTLSAPQIAPATIKIITDFVEIFGRCRAAPVMIITAKAEWMIWKSSYCLFRRKKAVTTRTNIAAVERYATF